MKDKVEVFFHSQQPYIHINEEDISQYNSGRLDFPEHLLRPGKGPSPL